MNRSRKEQNRGFSLIELIIAISILVILTGIIAPNIIRYIQRSRESACNENMTALMNIYKMRQLTFKDYTIEDLLDEYGAQNRCPDGGRYINITEKLGHPGVKCELHNAAELAKTPNTINREILYNYMQAFVGKKSSDIVAVLKDYYKGANPWLSNDWLRRYLGDKEMGGKWAQFDPEVLKEVYEGKAPDLYIQPYLNIPKAVNGEDALQKTKEADVILFANEKSDPYATDWNAYLIYNADDHKWYKSPDKKARIMVAGKSWETIRDEMTNAVPQWEPIKD